MEDVQEFDAHPQVVAALQVAPAALESDLKVAAKPADRSEPATLLEKKQSVAAIPTKLAPLKALAILNSAPVEIEQKQQSALPAIAVKERPEEVVEYDDPSPVNQSDVLMQKMLQDDLNHEAISMPKYALTETAPEDTSFHAKAVIAPQHEKETRSSLKLVDKIMKRAKTSSEAVRTSITSAIKAVIPTKPKTVVKKAAVDQIRNLQAKSRSSLNISHGEADDAVETIKMLQSRSSEALEVMDIE
jgi:hypothetical protein